MLTISAVTSSGGASRYYSHDNYYTQDEGIEHSQWMGQGSDLLGLQGQVDPAQFAALLNGQVDGEQLGRTTKDGIQHRPGWDLTFSAPKSVSILSEVYGVQAVREAHQKAVKEALAHIEKNYIQTRISAGGKVVRLQSESAIFATFTHDVSRELDPQLHTHAVMINATNTPNGWRSIANEKLMDRNAILEGGMAYRMALAHELTQQGYTLKMHRDPSLWELEGVPDGLMKEFSKRASQIQQYFEDRGLPYDSAYAKQVALLTRKRKDAIPREELTALWRERAAGHSLSNLVKEFEATPVQADTTLPDGNTRVRPDGNTQVRPDGNTRVRPDDNTRVRPGGNASLRSGLSTKEVRRNVKNAMDHLLEKDMGFSEIELKREAARLGLGRTTMPELDAEIQRLKQSGGLIEARTHPERNETLYTTRKAKSQESRLLAILEKGRGVGKALVSTKKAETFLAKSTLNDQQRNAVMASVQTQDRFSAIQGDPGVGKTHTLKAYKNLLEKQGYAVMGFAPSYQAVNELSSSLDVPGMTVDRFLVDPNANRQVSSLAKQVWIVDEASMLSTDKMYQIMDQAQRQDARVLLVGDQQQLESVGAGRAFKHLQEARIEVAVIDKRMRQQTEQLKLVVDHVMAKRYDAAFDAMNEAGQVIASRDARDKHEPLRSLAAEYLSRDPERQAKTLVVAPTNEQRAEINRLIRDGLKEQGAIKGRDFDIEAFKDVRLSDQEKRMASQYKNNQYVRFNYEYRDTEAKVQIDRHEYFQVIGRNTETNVLALKSEASRQTIFIDPAKIGGNRPGGLQVFEKESLSLAEGDRVRWLDNSNKQGLKRNTEMTVVRGHQDWVRLEDGKGRSYSLSLSDMKHRHFEHDYSRTAYGVQGKTDREVLAVMESWRKNTVNQRSFMVSLTRASHDLRVYVDDLPKLKTALRDRSGDNVEALSKSEFEQSIRREKEKAKQQQQPGRKFGIPRLI